MNTRTALQVRRIPAAETIPLRHSVLRPGHAVQEAHFPGDDDANTAHFGAFRNGELLCVASLYQASFPGEPETAAFQLRGMATAPEVRGSGLGTAIVNACIAHAREKGAALLWCNARTSAAEFYRKLGFQIVGGEFDIPTVGPHFRMKLDVI